MTIVDVIFSFHDFTQACGLSILISYVQETMNEALTSIVRDLNKFRGVLSQSKVCKLIAKVFRNHDNIKS